MQTFRYLGKVLLPESFKNEFGINIRKRLYIVTVIICKEYLIVTVTIFKKYLIVTLIWGGIKIIRM